MTIPAVGSAWEVPSLVWGLKAGQGGAVRQESPLGFVVQESRLLSEAELAAAFAESGPWNGDDLEVWTQSLAQSLSSQRADYLDAIRVSTGFALGDCEEVFDSTLEFVKGFKTRKIEEHETVRTLERDLHVVEYPWGTVAAVLPQNAFFSLALTVLLNGLSTGNRVVLRAPTGGLRIGAMLAQSLTSAGFPPACFSVVLADAGNFIEAWAGSSTPCLLHYMGSSARAPDLLQRSWTSGKPILIDGTGNTWMFVDRDQDPEEAASTVWKGSIRYNGETCTSINGAIVHPDVFDALTAALRTHVDVCRYGCDVNAEVGPLFNTRQAAEMRLVTERSNGTEHRAGNDAAGVFAPTLVVNPSWDSELVREGVFAPAVWVAPGSVDDFERNWNLNQYPLCAGVLSQVSETVARIKRLPNASRIVINGDPSVEDPMEPWGAYPRCGLNPVGAWDKKYLRCVQMDLPRPG